MENNLEPTLGFLVKELGMDPTKLRQVGVFVNGWQAELEYFTAALAVLAFAESDQVPHGEDVLPFRARINI